MALPTKTVNIKVTEKGTMKPLDLFQAFEDGVRKRLPKYVAAKYKELLISNIYLNKFNFKLSDKWVNYKKIKGWDHRPFIAEGYYIDAIEIYSADGHLSVGFKARKRHPRSKLTMSRIALILEFGRLDMGLPARPLWRYTATEFFNTMDTLLETAIKKQFEFESFKYET